MSKTKVELATDALKVLGIDAPAADVQSYLRKYAGGAKVGDTTVSSARAALRRSGWKPPAKVEGEHRSDPTIVPGVGEKATATTSAPTTAPASTTEGSIILCQAPTYLENLLAVKELANKVGGLLKLMDLVADYEKLVS